MKLDLMNNTPSELIDDLMNSIIDENHKLFKATTDEKLVESNEQFSVYQRYFKHKNGKTFLMKWKVNTSDSGNWTEFMPAETVS